MISPSTEEYLLRSTMISTTDHEETLMGSVRLLLPSPVVSSMIVASTGDFELPSSDLPTA